jgi:hypothetical protein
MRSLKKTWPAKKGAHFWGPILKEVYRVGNLRRSVARRTPVNRYGKVDVENDGIE